MQRRVAEPEAVARDLQARLGRDASDSSLPPSADPPGAPKPVTERPTGNEPGGQPGHAGGTRARLPAERVPQVVRDLPATCRGCGEGLPSDPAPGDPAPTGPQVAERPATAAVIAEHQGHARTGPGCGGVPRQPIPAAVRAHAIGPRLAAVTAYLPGARHDSKRGVGAVVETVVGAPVGRGTVAAVEQEVGAALAPAHAEVGRVVRRAPAKHADETGWKKAGELCWLWAAATARAAYLVVRARRGPAGLGARLGERGTGVAIGDRRSA